ncbi:hypothetical protein KJ865_05325, partial [Myxococcota bacterium]|nr:hypothetical protein [Myxococcota bacterium]
MLKKLTLLVFLLIFWGCDSSSSGSGVSCGDNSAASSEECDGTDLKGASCVTRGYEGGTLLCNLDCTFDISACQTAARCGDAELNSAGEECDGEDFGGVDCVSLGYYRGNLECSDQCQLSTDNCERCGDGVLAAADGEACDGADFGGLSCSALNFPQGELVCTEQCTLGYAGCTHGAMWGGSQAVVPSAIAAAGGFPLYVTGTAAGTVEGWGGHGGTDLFVSKIANDLSRTWTVQIGT